MSEDYYPEFNFGKLKNAAKNWADYYKCIEKVLLFLAGPRLEEKKYQIIVVVPEPLKRKFPEDDNDWMDDDVKDWAIWECINWASPGCENIEEDIRSFYKNINEFQINDWFLLRITPDESDRIDEWGKIGDSYINLDTELVLYKRPEFPKIEHRTDSDFQKQAIEFAEKVRRKGYLNTIEWSYIFGCEDQYSTEQITAIWRGCRLDVRGRGEPDLSATQNKIACWFQMFELLTTGRDKGVSVGWGKIHFNC